jgi:hypothetical protein
MAGRIGIVSRLMVAAPTFPDHALDRGGGAPLLIRHPGLPQALCQQRKIIGPAETDPVGEI